MVAKAAVSEEEVSVVKQYFQRGGANRLFFLLKAENFFMIFLLFHRLIHFARLFLSFNFLVDFTIGFSLRNFIFRTLFHWTGKVSAIFRETHAFSFPKRFFSWILLLFLAEKQFLEGPFTFLKIMVF